MKLFPSCSRKYVTNNVTITGFFNHWHISFLWFLLSDPTKAVHSKAMISIFIEFKTEINLGLGLKHGVKIALQSFCYECSMKMPLNQLEILVKVMVTCSGESPWEFLLLN